MLIFSGIFGISFALVQKNIKKALAYSSIENVGIITIGIGLGLLGIEKNIPFLALLGFGGSCVHIFNHAIYKGLLFLGAGSIYFHTQTEEISLLGGLAKKTPITSRSFLIGSLSIAAIPSFNGFVGEFFIYLAAFEGIFAKCSVCFLVLLGLALIGGLALLCFTGLYGIIFLGEGRSLFAQNAKIEKRSPMTFSMNVLSFFCMGLGLTLPFLLPYLSPLLALFIKGMTPQSIHILCNEKASHFYPFFQVLLTVYLSFFLVYTIRKLLYKRKTPAQTVTWDCGYSKPTSRMQYTFSSFVQPIVAIFEKMACATDWISPKNIFWKKASFTQTPQDPWFHHFYHPIFKHIEKFAAVIRWVQHGQLQSYIFYIFLTLITLLLWKVG
ncbi:MAG: proton-conducting transporter membrane subunit [Chlamydiota bacterium]